MIATTDLPLLVFQALLLLCRLGAAVLLLPGLGEQDIPASIRLALALALVGLLQPALAPLLPALPAAPVELLRLVLLEVAVGIWLGLLARLVVLALTLAGQIIALMIGLASPLQLDPALGGQSTAPARLFGLLAAVLVLGSGLWALPLRALVESYALLPAGGPLPLGAGAEALAAALGGCLAVALRLAAPLVLAAILANMALALLSRLVPQMQVYAIALPGQLLGGFLLLALLAAPLLATGRDALVEGFGLLPGAR